MSLKRVEKGSYHSKAVQILLEVVVFLRTENAYQK
jgi:hypothetical protein